MFHPLANPQKRKVYETKPVYIGQWINACVFMWVRYQPAG
jgi:hypothetical protein